MSRCFTRPYITQTPVVQPQQIEVSILRNRRDGFAMDAAQAHVDHMPSRPSVKVGRDLPVWGNTTGDGWW